MKDSSFLPFIRLQCILDGSAVIFSVFESFLILKREDLISWCELIVQNGWIISSSAMYFNIKHLKNRNFSSVIRFQCILHDSVALLSVFGIFVELKTGDLISLGELILQNDWIIWSSPIYLNIKYLKDPNSSSVIRFQCALHDSAVLLWVFENFLNLKTVDLISCGELILQNSWRIWSPLLCFNIKHLKDRNSLSLIRFQCVLHDSAVLSWVFQNFLNLKTVDLISLGEPILQNDWIVWSSPMYFNTKHSKYPNSL